ncbi:MAG: NBR1-Ig-like domain-containing protein [Anaerolineaceae bacterium]
MKYRIVWLMATILMVVGGACGQQKTVLPVSSSGTQALPILANCRQAELVDETVPPGSQYQAGEKFDKTWIIRNTSPCNWSYQFSLVYYDGIGMGASASRVFTENMPADAVIRPGETATLTLNLRAPFAPGRQVGYWKLRDPSGMLFMPSNSNQESLSVDIIVVGTVYSFADNLCQAAWTLDGQTIDCPLSGADETLNLSIDNFPHFETGAVENEPAIRVMLPGKEGSALTATFPVMLISKGDHLHVITACAYDTPQCDLIFEISYLSDAGSGILGEWHEIYDNQIQTVDLQLSDLTGKQVQFVFSVRSNGTFEINRGYWFFPILLPY